MLGAARLRDAAAAMRAPTHTTTGVARAVAPPRCVFGEEKAAILVTDASFAMQAKMRAKRGARRPGMREGSRLWIATRCGAPVRALTLVAGRVSVPLGVAARGPLSKGTKPLQSRWPKAKLTRLRLPPSLVSRPAGPGRGEGFGPTRVVDWPRSGGRQPHGH